MASLTTQRYPDIESMLQEHGAGPYEYRPLSLDEIDIETSRGNQARFKPVDDKTVAKYKFALEAGAEFPPIIVYKQRGKKLYTIIDGNHRDEAYRACGLATIPAIVLTQARPMAVAILTVAANGGHGLPTTREEDKAHGVHLIELGAKSEVAAQLVGMSASALRNEIAKRKARERGRQAGIDKIWRELPVAVQTQLNKISTDDTLVPAAKLASQANLDVEDVKQLVSTLDAATTVKQQHNIIKAARAEHSDEIQNTGGGKIPEARFARGNAPRTVLSRAMGSLAVLPDDDEIVVRSFTPSEVPECVERIETVIGRLEKLVAAFREIQG